MGRLATVPSRILTLVASMKMTAYTGAVSTLSLPTIANS